MMIFPGHEVIEAIKEQDNKPDDEDKLIHLEALLSEFLRNVRIELLHHYGLGGKVNEKEACSECGIEDVSYDGSYCCRECFL